MNILLVDDHPVFRSGLNVMLQKTFGKTHITEVGDYAGLETILDEIPDLDLVLLDLYFPGFDAANDFIKIRQRLPVTPLVVVSMVYDSPLIEGIMQQGANGFVSKSAAPETIIETLKEIMDGETVVVKNSGQRYENRKKDPLTELTRRQLDVLRFVAQGMSNKEIARELGLSPHTVRLHVSAMLRTLGLSSRAAAASFATARGIL